MKPLIGVTTYREQARWGAWDALADVLHADYAKSVETAGGVPVLLPPSDDPSAAAEVVVARLDGLIISGGADVDPDQYGEDVGEHTLGWREDRDAWELALLDAVDATELPVLGICRGMQVMAVHAGGRLEQHMPDVIGTVAHGPGGDVFGEITVETVPGSVLAGIVGPSVPVRCHHHQSVRSHPGFVATAYASDGTLEAMENRDRRFRLAVQWHPETYIDQGLFAALVEAASIYSP